MLLLQDTVFGDEGSQIAPKRTDLTREGIYLVILFIAISNAVTLNMLPRARCLILLTFCTFSKPVRSIKNSSDLSKNKLWLALSY